MERELDNPKNPDMSPDAIEERFRMVEALRKLCVSLKEAGERGPIGDAREDRRIPDVRLASKAAPPNPSLTQRVDNS